VSTNNQAPNWSLRAMYTIASYVTNRWNDLQNSGQLMAFSYYFSDASFEQTRNFLKGAIRPLSTQLLKLAGLTGILTYLGYHTAANTHLFISLSIASVFYLLIFLTLEIELIVAWRALSVETAQRRQRVATLLKFADIAPVVVALVVSVAVFIKFSVYMHRVRHG